MNGYVLLPGDALVVRAWHLAPAVSRLQITSVVEDENGRQRMSRTDFFPLVYGHAYFLPLGAGRLISVCAVNLDTSSARELYVHVDLVRPSGLTTGPVAPLISCYLHGLISAGWSCDAGPVVPRQTGCLLTYHILDPGAGNEIEDHGLLEGDWAIASVRFVLEASAAVANRDVYLGIGDALGNLFPVYNGAHQTAGMKVTYCFFGYGAYFGPTATYRGVYMPPFQIHNVVNLETSTPGLDAADEFTQIYIDVLPLR